MALTFHPHPGDVLVCNFNTGFHPPEMVKVRPVVVISQRHRRVAEVLTVVPLSTTQPIPMEDHHYQVDASGLPGNFSLNPTWAKCDMVVSVGVWRLDQIKVREYGGTRTYHTGKLSDDDLLQIRSRVGRLIGLTIPDPQA